jgi:VWFA-related protein
MNRTSLLLGVLACAAIVSAQAPQPTFQLSVNYVDVDVTVTDAQGHFVTGLTRDDFQLLEDGKPQNIDTFSLVELPIERTDRFLALGRSVPADVRSNRDVSSGRVYMIVLDDLNVSALRTTAVRKSARQFIERQFGPRDIAAVVTTSGRKDTAQEFTSDPALLLAAIDKFIGQRLQSAEIERIDQYYVSQLSGVDEITTDDQGRQKNVRDPLTRNQSFDPSNLERAQRAVGVLNTLRNLADYLDGIRGRRKALLLFSEGIDYPMAEIFNSPAGDDITSATEDAISAAAHANVNFFTLDPRGLMGMTTDFIEMTRSGPPDYAGADFSKPAGTPHSGVQALLGELRLTQDSLRTLAEGTGGFPVVDANSADGAFDRIVQANSQYYLLGYTPPNHPRDGRFHRIQVTVKRPGLNAVARRGYPSPSGRTPEERKRDDLNRRARESRNGGAPGTSPELRDALNSPVQQPGLTFAVQAAAFKSAPKEASLALTVEMDGAQLQLAPQLNSLLTNTLELSFFALNEDGKPQKGTRMAANLVVRPETYERMKTLGLRFNVRTPLAPGRYQLRVGARDPIGNKAGTVFYDVRVPDFTRDPLMMSGLLLSSPGAPEVLTPQRDPIAERLLGAPATSRRVFTQNETLALVAEIYDNTPAVQARQFDVTASLLGEDGREVFAARDSLTNEPGPAAHWTAVSYAKQISLKNIAPGRYLLRVEARNRADASDRSPTAAETVITVTPGG